MSSPFHPCPIPLFLPPSLSHTAPFLWQHLPDSTSTLQYFPLEAPWCGPGPPCHSSWSSRAEPAPQGHARTPLSLHSWPCWAWPLFRTRVGAPSCLASGLPSLLVVVGGDWGGSLDGLAGIPLGPHVMSRHPAGHHGMFPLKTVLWVSFGPIRFRAGRVGGWQSQPVAGIL